MKSIETLNQKLNPLRHFKPKQKQLFRLDCAAFAANIILIGNGKKETTFLHSILLKKELNVFGSRNSYPKDFAAVIDLIASGSVNVLDMVSDVYPIERADEAFKALANNDGSLAKVLVNIGDR